MEGGGSGEDQCQDEVEEKVREGRRQDNIILEQDETAGIEIERAESKGEIDLCPP